MAEFEPAVEYVLDNEKGYSDRIDDLGGPTNFGITIPVLSKYRGRHVTNIDIQNLDLNTAKDIYYVLYWVPLDLDKFIQSISTAILDIEINTSGPGNEGRAIRCAQKVLGMSVTDGILGPITTNALLKITRDNFIPSFVSVVQDFYVDIVIARPDQISNLKGWLARARKLFSLQ